MSRRAALALCACLLLVSASCNRGITPGVLRFSHFWSEPAQRAYMDTMLAGFHREHPEIPVEVSELSWSDGKTKLMVGFNSETAPDILELGSDWVAQFSASGVLLPLDSNASLIERFTNSPAYSHAPGMWGRHYYAVPWLLDTRVIFINDQLAGSEDASDGARESHVTQAFHDWDWKTMQSLADAIHRAGSSGIGVNGPDQHRLYKKFLPYVWSNGGDLFDSLGHPTMNSPENIEALRFYVDQIHVGVMETQKNLDDAFVRGKLGVWFSGSWLLPRLVKAPFRWHTMLFPGNNDHHGESFAGGEYLAINKNSAMKREAQVFLEYITRRDNELAFARRVNEYPADIQSQSDTFYLHRREGSVFTEQLQHARMTPVIPQWLDVEAIIEDEVSEALYKRETPEQAMASMQRRTEERMKQP
ncbi:MAG: extracellular solute-binding protein [Bacteroidota bacterium]|nr:extracellular solute-binding protein [Bacteroidota bacterium]MDP4233774.1 extracellular solute-binding protein [Bacteroidota bacterium]MDP4242413.1 extracellular solute-binding protein [Bacteroidota bacterium]MDP4287535.1 extracellular solute-binding protein [Bacteroidota bacterium]